MNNRQQIPQGLQPGDTLLMPCTDDPNQMDRMRVELIHGVLAVRLPVGNSCRLLNDRFYQYFDLKRLKGRLWRADRKIAPPNEVLKLQFTFVIHGEHVGGIWQGSGRTHDRALWSAIQNMIRHYDLKLTPKLLLHKFETHPQQYSYHSNKVPIIQD